MNELARVFVDAFAESWNGLRDALTGVRFDHVFWVLLVISAFAALLERTLPWREQQPVLRRDFWLDGFYMLFNTVLFPVLGFQAAVATVGWVFEHWLGADRAAIFDLGGWPFWARALVFFVVRDFVQWHVHRLMHRVPWFWEFHKVHHSVHEMGFAASLRLHPLERVVYTAFESLGFALFGFQTGDYATVLVFTLLMGHLNHANVGWSYGPLRYLFSSPQMHSWHHARNLPASHPIGVNFGITLSLWDWLFGTAHWPHSARDEPLGFPGDGTFPAGFLGQLAYPFRPRALRGVSDRPANPAP